MRAPTDLYAPVSKLGDLAAAISKASPAIRAYAVAQAAAGDALAARVSALEEAAANPPSSPPPVLSVWAWDAMKATVSAKAPPTFTVDLLFGAVVAHADAPTGTPFYSIPMQEVGKAMSCPVPLGTQPGCSNDASLTVRYANGVQYDFGNASYNAATRQISGAYGIATVQPGAAYEDAPQSANAACFPLAAGLVTPDDVRSGVIAHPLTLSMPNVGPAPNPYPARPGSDGYPGNTGVPLGTWLRVNPAAADPAGLTTFELMLRAAAKRHGIFVRDIGTYDVTVNGADQVNQGGNAADWPAVGVQLPAKTPAGVPYALKLNPATFAGLQVLLPPSSP